MKRLIPIVLIAFFILNSTKSKATHVLGGEISWECLISGKFIFTMKLYRACYLGSAGLGSTYSISNPLYSQYGGASSIMVVNTNNPPGIDLSLPCYDPQQSVPCGIPAPAGQSAIEEHIFVSQPVQINGIPDTNGSAFTFSLCCRPSLLNIIGQSNFWMRATMFPFTKTGNTSPESVGSGNSPSCFDSSPSFVARPVARTCFGSSTVMNLMASDLDADSLTYHWTPPMQSATNKVIWNTGYDSVNQFPTTFHDPNNIPASLDTTTGLVNFTAVGPTNEGYYQHGIKVSSYKKGQLVAEVYRDLPIVIMNCSMPLINTAPTVEFKNSTSSTYKTVLDTAIQVGSFIELDIRSTDLDTLPLASPNNKQSITVEVIGEALSTIPNNSASCSSAPCAYLDTIGNIHWKGYLQEYQDTSEVNIKFKWYTSCELLYSTTPYEGKPRAKKFQFTISSHDNSCPLPAQTFEVFYITLYDSVTTLTPIVNIDASQGGALVEWNEYKGPNFVSYQLMHAIDGVQPYVQIAQTLSSADTSYLDQVARTDTVSHSYYVLVNNQIGCESFSNMIERSIYLEGVEAVQGVYLNWNRPTPVLTHAGNYTINRKLGTSNWTVLKNNQAYPAVFSEWYSDFDQWQVIENYYRIDAMDSRGHASISNVALVERDTPSYWGIDEAYLPQVQFVPNPFKNELILIDEDGQLQGEKLIVFNILGEQVKEFVVDVPRYQMDMRALKPGVYFVRYRDKNGILGSQRILKTE